MVTYPDGVAIIGARVRVQPTPSKNYYPANLETSLRSAFFQVSGMVKDEMF